MNCALATGLHQSYLDGDLSRQLRLEMDSHVIRCPTCQKSLALLDAVGNVVADAPPASLGADFTDRVLQAAASQQRWRIGRRRLVRWTAGIVSAAAAAAAVAIFGPGSHASDVETRETSPVTVASNVSYEPVETAGPSEPGKLLVDPLVQKVQVGTWLEAAKERLSEQLEQFGSDEERNAGLQWIWNTMGVTPDVAG